MAKCTKPHFLESSGFLKKWWELSKVHVLSPKGVLATFERSELDEYVNVLDEKSWQMKV